MVTGQTSGAEFMALQSTDQGTHWDTIAWSLNGILPVLGEELEGELSGTGICGFVEDRRGANGQFMRTGDAFVVEYL